MFTILITQIPSDTYIVMENQNVKRLLKIFNKNIYTFDDIDLMLVVIPFQLRQHIIMAPTFNGMKTVRNIFTVLKYLFYNCAIGQMRIRTLFEEPHPKTTGKTIALKGYFRVGKRCSAQFCFPVKFGDICVPCITVAWNLFKHNCFHMIVVYSHSF